MRQPQLSKKPDEAGLSHALTEALPPIPQELLADIAEALNQLEEDRRQLEEFQQLAQAIERFNQRYRTYAGTLSRRQARELRQAQTDFDNASRERNGAQMTLQNAKAMEAQAHEERQQAELALAAHRTRLDTLLSDPANQDASRLDTARQDAEKRQKSAEADRVAREEAAGRLDREEREVRGCADRVGRAENSLKGVRQECARHADTSGVTAEYASHPLAVFTPLALAEMKSHDIDGAQSGLRKTISARRQDLALLRRRHSDLAQSESALAQHREVQREKQDEFEAAGRRRADADAAVEHASQALIDDWSSYCANLQQLQFNADAYLAELSQWVLQPEGTNPVQQALLHAHHQSSTKHAARQAELDRLLEKVHQEQSELESDRLRLIAGRDTIPPLPYTRMTDTRVGLTGAPLWQLIDFRDHVDALKRAGIEASLEASGMLDAWVTSDGALVAITNEAPWQDIQIVARRATPSTSLGSWLQAAVPDGISVPSEFIERLLAFVTCTEHDSDDSEAWISPDGRFRIGAVKGAWSKPEAVYIGFAARAAARVRRLEVIGQRLNQLVSERSEIMQKFEQLAAERAQAEQELRGAPPDQQLMQTHLTASTRERELQEARSRLTQVHLLCRDAELATQKLRDALAQDAADLRLPLSASALPLIEDALNEFNDAQYRLALAVHEWRRAWPELQRQRTRQEDAAKQLSQSEARLADSRIEAKEAQACFAALRESVGAKVEELRQHLADARQNVQAAETILKTAIDAFIEKGKQRAVADARAEMAQATLVEHTEARAQAITRLQRFTESSLLSSALPEIELPAPRTAWTIDSALTLARRAEQELSSIKDDDNTLSRLQRQIAEDLTELQRALSVLGHQASAEPSAWGFVVQIVYQNRAERPDRLTTRLRDEIAQRSELLTAKEREVLENHLQAEIATEIQRLLQSAEKHKAAINMELQKRPTSTGMRYRLQWLPLTENDGAPAGLEAARQRLLNTSADLWSSEDRSVVGRMLQQRIADERKISDAGLERGGGGSLIDQLSRALDYRRWHQFRVQRLQDGQWRKLSGPASSGERALGLTVPLFAAIASFYSHGCYVHAPRLMLLDEAFAGIDDAARAHCMALVREFDLDFIITSEREWGCYAELPGVAICQLLRREGIDAIYVSRWTWDGRSKRREEDPDRRFETA